MASLEALKKQSFFSKWVPKRSLGTRERKWLQGLGTLLHPYNFLSLAAILEGRHWVRG